MTASTTYVGKNSRDIEPTEGEQDVAHDVLMQTAALQETRSRVGKQVSRTDEYVGSRLPPHLSFCWCQRMGDSRARASEDL